MAKTVKGWENPFMQLLVALFSFAVYGYFFAVFLHLGAWIINLTDVPGFDILKPYLPCGVIDKTTGTWMKKEYFGWLQQVTARCTYCKVLYNAILLGNFALPHSLFARLGVKAMFGHASDGEVSVYRAIYVLQSAVSLNLMMYGWHPIEGAPIWEVSTKSQYYWPLVGFYFFGLFWLLTSTFALDHFNLFGLSQGFGVDFMKMMGASLGEKFSNRLHYKLVRHPIMTGFFIMFWSTPVMTMTHLVFAVLNTLYILIAVIAWEEPDLHAIFPKDYGKYCKKTPQFCPLNKIFYLGGSDEHKKTD